MRDFRSTGLSHPRSRCVEFQFGSSHLGMRLLLSLSLFLSRCSILLRLRFFSLSLSLPLLFSGCNRAANFYDCSPMLKCCFFCSYESVRSAVNGRRFYTRILYTRYLEKIAAVEGLLRRSRAVVNRDSFPTFFTDKIIVPRINLNGVGRPRRKGRRRKRK